MLQFYGQPKVLTEVLGYCNQGLITVFSIECVLKLFAYGVRVSCQSAVSTNVRESVSESVSQSVRV